MSHAEKIRLNDTKALQLIEEMLGKVQLHELGELSTAGRNMLLQKLKSIEGLSIRQIARLTGINFNIVKRA